MTDRKNDVAWQIYLDAKGITFDLPTYDIDAEELRRITGREARLLVKFDTPEQMPSPLRTAGYTLLPVRNGQYRLVEGSLFVRLPTCDRQSDFKPQTPFPLFTEGRGQGESQYIDQAYNSGLLQRFLGVSELYQTVRGREYTKRFTFRWKDEEITVESVQIEVDAGYEALDDIVLVEAKIGVPDNFNVRQLYYPYRHFSTLVPQKRIRPVFLGYDLPTTTYHLFEYTFADQYDPLSGRVNRCGVFRVSPPRHFSIYQLLDVRFQTDTNIVPQADDLNKIYELLLLVEADLNHADDVADYFGFDIRQSNYYREAAEYLGLTISSKQTGYALTERGIALLSEAASSQPSFLAKVIVNSWVFSALIRQARSSAYFTNTDIENIIGTARKTDGSVMYSGSTPARRRRTITAWIRWLAQEIGCFAVEGEIYRLQ